MSNSSDLGWCVYEAGSRATACACLRRDVFRRAGCREIRLSGSTRGEWVARKCRPLSYSTGPKCFPGKGAVAAGITLPFFRGLEHVVPKTAHAALRARVADHPGD